MRKLCCLGKDEFFRKDSFALLRNVKTLKSHSFPKGPLEHQGYTNWGFKCRWPWIISMKGFSHLYRACFNLNYTLAVTGMLGFLLIHLYMEGTVCHCQLCAKGRLASAGLSTWVSPRFASSPLHFEAIKDNVLYSLILANAL